MTEVNRAVMLNGMAPEPNQFDELLVPFDVRPQPLPADVRLSRPKFFPIPTATTPEGLLCVGGRLTPDWLLDAYRHGIFPWPMWDDDPILWWSPDPRAIFEMDGLHVSRRLARTVRSGKFDVSFDRDFPGVIEGCADRPGHGVWITKDMIAAYTRLHRLGFAHSVEVRHQGRLAGGLYGVAVGGLFAGESMFSRVRDASKVALVHLVSHLRRRGYPLFDVQYPNDPTARPGA